LAHLLDYLGGSKLMPGLAKPLSFDIGIPVEHIEHPHEFGFWLDYLQNQFDVQLDADDTIISYLYKNEMLIKGTDIEKQDKVILKSKSDRIMRFLSEKSADIDALIRELPGYIGSRVGKVGERRTMQFIDLAAQQQRIRQQIRRENSDCTSITANTLWPEINALEKDWPSLWVSNTVLPVHPVPMPCSWLLWLRRWGPGDTIFTTPFTFIATAEVISLLGATPCVC